MVFLLDNLSSHISFPPSAHHDSLLSLFVWGGECEKGEQLANTQRHHSLWARLTKNGAQPGILHFCCCQTTGTLEFSRTHTKKEAAVHVPSKIPIVQRIRFISLGGHSIGITMPYSHCYLGWRVITWMGAEHRFSDVKAVLCRSGPLYFYYYWRSFGFLGRMSCVAPWCLIVCKPVSGVTVLGVALFRVRGLTSIQLAHWVDLDSSRADFHFTQIKKAI